jgi:hypothetical protein
MLPGGPVRQPCFYSAPSPHGLFKNSCTECVKYIQGYENSHANLSFRSNVVDIKIFVRRTLRHFVHSDLYPIFYFLLHNFNMYYSPHNSNLTESLRCLPLLFLSVRYFKKGPLTRNSSRRQQVSPPSETVRVWYIFTGKLRGTKVVSKYLNGINLKNRWVKKRK